MKILITTGVYPPAIGGPAQYAKNLADTFRAMGHDVLIKTFGIENWLPTGIRHFVFFLKTLVALRGVDVILALDTFSVALPALLAARIFRKKFIIRTGGDFLWESYVERTEDLVLFRNFYQTSVNKFSIKEKIIFWLTKKILNNSSAIIFSTAWQRDIFVKPYNLDLSKLFIVENYYGTKAASFEPRQKDFIAGTRLLKWKNHNRLKEAFAMAKSKDPSLICDNSNQPYNIFIDKLSKAYAVVLVSLGDISPNMILDAVRCNKPFIVTKEIGIYDRIKDCAVFVDPENIEDIALKIEWLLNPINYAEQKKKIESFNFKHTWEDIAGEFLAIVKKI